MMTVTDQILVGESGENIFIRVEGRGHFQNSHSLKQLALLKIEKGQVNLVIDLEKCIAMDSTFMGVLAGIAIKLKKENHPLLKVINASPHSFDLLDTLGITHLLEIQSESVESQPEASPLEGEKADKSEIAQHMLEAHETLSNLSGENKVKFQNVIDYLKIDLEKFSE